MPTLQAYDAHVQPEWVDYNGHLRDAFYALIFSHATDALMDHIGLDAAGRACHHSSLYTLETHISYLHEVHAHQAVHVQTQLIAHDAKRLHVHQAMVVDGRIEPVAVAEQLLLHVTTGGPRAAAFPDVVMARVEALAAEHLRLRAPSHVGRSIRLQSSSTSSSPA